MRNAREHRQVINRRDDRADLHAGVLRGHRGHDGLFLDPADLDARIPAARVALDAAVAWP